MCYCCKEVVDKWGLGIVGFGIFYKRIVQLGYSQEKCGALGPIGEKRQCADMIKGVGVEAE